MLQSVIDRIPDHSFTLSKRPAAFPTGVWEQATGGRGPYVQLASSRRLDWMCALGALTVGHAHPKVVDAVCVQMQRGGTIFSLPHYLEAIVAERLCRRIPCAEQLRVVKTGSEACSAAVRIARMATGRTLVLTTPTSYHGWHDALIAAKPSHPGVPDAFAQTIVARDFYNDVETLELLLSMRADAGDPVAAVMFEPVQGVPPNTGFLRDVVDLAHDYGTLVIFDEMLCGGRLAFAGAQEYYQVTPDLATFGKALGGGLPFAFVCGRPDIMRHAWPVSGTFSGDVLALAAANAMMDIYDSEDVIEKLWKHGRIAQEALLQVAAAYDTTLVIHGHPPRFWLDFAPHVDKRLALSVFSQQAAKRGQLVHPAVIFASAAMTTQQATEGAAALAAAMEVVCGGIRDGNLSTLLRGEPYADSVR